jgi:hypothetical protein
VSLTKLFIAEHFLDATGLIRGALIIQAWFNLTPVTSSISHINTGSPDHAVMPVEANPLVSHLALSFRLFFISGIALILRTPANYN